MFDTPDAARQFFLEHFETPQVEILVEALEPSIVFDPCGAARLGGTRIGGTPDLPPGLDWPKPVLPENAAEIATRGSKDANEELKEHFKLGLPYAFFAQVDLAEAKALGGLGDDLPGEGRLLLFYDLIAGPYDSGVWTAKVIWDQSPVASLVPQSLPQPLRAAADARRKFEDELNAKMIKQYGKDAAVTRAKDAGTPYDAPARAMTLKTTLRTPEREALELQASPRLTALLNEKSDELGEETFADRYSEMFGKRFDPYYDPKNRGHRNQLLGGPLSEQSDPRYSAVVASEYGKPHLPSEEWDKRRAEIDAKAKDWRLLLQIDVADWMQADGEGTVYFMIRREDLKARRFDKVTAIYQQT